MKIELKDNVLHLGSLQIDLQHRAMLSLVCWMLFPNPEQHHSSHDTRR